MCALCFRLSHPSSSRGGVWRLWHLGIAWDNSLIFLLVPVFCFSGEVLREIGCTPVFAEYAPMITIRRKNDPVVLENVMVFAPECM